MRARSMVARGGAGEPGEGKDLVVGGGNAYDASKKSPVRGEKAADAAGVPAWMGNAQWIPMGDPGSEAAPPHHAAQDSLDGIEPADIPDTGGATDQAATRERSRGSRLALVAGIATVILVVVAIVDITYLVFFKSKDAIDAPPAATSTSAPPEAPLPAPPPPVPFGDPTATVSVIGAQCLPGSSPGVTSDGSTAYCEQLQTTDLSMWSLVPGQIPPPVSPGDPSVGICTAQLGRTETDCVDYLQRPNFPGDGGAAAATPGS